MKFIDIHSHVQFAAYDIDRDEVMKRAQEQGVGMINVGTQQDTSKAAVGLAHQYPGDHRITSDPYKQIASRRTGIGNYE